MNGNLLGEYIIKKREGLGFSLRDVASRAEISPSQLSKIERGAVKNPSEKTIENIAYAINEDKDALLALAGKISRETILDPSYFEHFTVPYALNERLAAYGEMAADAEIAASSERPLNLLEMTRREHALRHVLEHFPGRENFALGVMSSVLENDSELGTEKLLLLVKEMIAAYDLTLKREVGVKRSTGRRAGRLDEG